MATPPPTGRTPGPLPTGRTPGPLPTQRTPGPLPTPQPGTGRPGGPQPGGQQPGPGQPGAAQPGPGQPGPGQPSAPRTTPPFHSPEDFPTRVSEDGRLAWALGLLGLLGVPGLAALVMSIVMLVVGLLQRRRNPVAAHVGTRAAIFGGITLATVIAFFTILIIGMVTTDPTRTYDTPPPLGIALIVLGIWMILVGPLVGVVMGIVALVRPVSRDKAAAILERAANAPR